MPVVVKPVCGGSSFGVSLVRTGDDFDKAISEAFKYDSKVLIEEYVKGREFMMAVIGTKDITVSEPGEIIHDGEILDYSGKYIKETTKTSIAANLDQNDVKTLKRYSEIIYRALDCSCYARIDFFKEEKTGRIIFNEINTMPVIAQMSIFTKLWNKQGITYSGLLKKIIASGFEKYGIWIRESVEIPEIEKLPQEIRQNRL